jgi:poly(A) polymerase
MKHLQILQYLNTTFDANFYLVGGFVRDMLSGIVSDDYDIATDLKPDEILAIAEQKNLKVIPTGLQHGTVTLIHEDKALEITTFRKDLENNGRHAKVEFTKSIKEDSFRRDFSINAIYLDANGMIYDFHDGQNDLKKGRVRFIGKPEDRIKEDYLRVLRFFRFYADFDRGGISLREPGLKETLINLCPNVGQLSADRIGQEIIKICKSKNYATAFATMLTIEPLQDLLSINYQTVNSKDIDLINQQDEFIKLCFIYRNNLQDLITNKHYNWSNNQKKLVKSFINFDFKAEIDEDNVVKLAAQYSQQVVEFILYARYLDGDIIKFDLLDMLAILAEGIPYFEVTGNDLIDLGFRADKTLGQALKLVKQYWLSNSFADKESCLDFARKIDKNSL